MVFAARDQVRDGIIKEKLDLLTARYERRWPTNEPSVVK